jgi:hypothetical protein
MYKSRTTNRIWTRGVVGTLVFIGVMLGPISVQNGSSFFLVNTAFGQAAPAANAGAAAQPNQNAQQVPSTTSCSGVLGYMSSFFTCMWRTATTWIAASLIWVAVTIMVWVGWLFDLTINQTVIGFNAWINGDVLKAISTGWTFFRDIANIAIIGLFVFIAINLILGIKTYGDRKLIARVLVVAVLINFSFLFTRIIINFSNAIAVQFAKVQPLGDTGTAAGTAPLDIAGKFTDLMGVKGWSNTKDSLQQIAQNNNSAWIALMHAFMVVIVALGVAIVLLYGTILLIARALIFIFLLVTSSLAFATYLLPTWASSDFGWKAWWTALFKNAMLAPIMMLFLAVTLQISQGLVAALNGATGQTAAGNAAANNGTGVLGALAVHPDDPKNISALLIYIIVLGLLYGAIRISNKFSGAAGQFAWSGTLPFASGLGNLGLNSLGVSLRSAGLLGRNTIGAGSEALGKKFNEAARNAGQGTWRNFSFDKLSQGFKSAAKRDYNPGNLTNIKAAQSNRGGYTGQQDRIAKESLARAQRTAPTPEAIERERNKASATANKEYENQLRSGQAQKSQAADAMKEAAKAIQQSTDQQKQLANDIGKMETKLSQMTPTQRSSTDGKTLEEEINNKKAEMRKKSADIETAKGQAQQATQQSGDAQKFEEMLRQKVAQRTEELMPAGMKADIVAKRDKEGNIVHDSKTGQPETKAAHELVADAGVRQALNTFQSTLKGVFKPQNEGNNALAQEVRKMASNVRKQTEKASAIEALLGRDYVQAQKQLEATKDMKAAIKGNAEATKNAANHTEHHTEH